MSFKEIIINKNSGVISLIWMFFIFLVLVLGVSLYFQANHAEEAQQQRLINETSSMAEDASNKLRSQLSLLKVLVSEYSPTFIKAEQTVALDQLNEKLESLLDDYKGFIIFNSAGELLFDRLVGGHEFEKRYAQSFLVDKQLNSSHFSSFEISQNPSSKQKRFYINFKEVGLDGQTYYFVVIRETQLYALEIMGEQAEGFERWLVERDTLNVVISGNQIYDFSKRVNIEELKGEKDIVRLINVDRTPWEVVVLTESNIFLTEAEKFLPTYIFFTLVYLVLGFIFRVRVYLLRNKHGENIEAINNQYKRSQQALSCINEVVITTNTNRRIIYCNNSSKKWLGSQPIWSVIDKPIAKIFPFKGMPWLVGKHQHNKLNGFHDHGEKNVDFNGKIITLNICQHFSN
jgi:PAS domain-containing protein